MRAPAVAGSFYPFDKNDLGDEVKKYLDSADLKVSGGVPIAAIAPHAGYMYSGSIAAYSYKRIRSVFDKPPVFIILGPNHTGEGAQVAVSKDDWSTPLGKIKVDQSIANAIVENSKAAEFDEEAHRLEHSIEVQLPFLQVLYKNPTFVPISLMANDIETFEDVGRSVFKAVEQDSRDFFMIASSDFTHYESVDEAKVKDSLAIEAIKKLDYKSFLETVESNHISICGYGPIATMLVYSKLKGASFIEILRYGHSGEVSGDASKVVAYASIVLTM
ncbi:MAG: MEMO1 family protein [Candidatus Micrarchaeota archaeon]|nr:MEMO1 family protein [Candidatus Micrarchaeota archaeon]